MIELSAQLSDPLVFGQNNTLVVISAIMITAFIWLRVKVASSTITKRVCVGTAVFFVGLAIHRAHWSAWRAWRHLGMQDLVISFELSIVPIVAVLIMVYGVFHAVSPAMHSICRSPFWPIGAAIAIATVWLGSAELLYLFG